MRIMRILFLALAWSVLSGTALASQAITIEVNGYGLKVDVPPIVQEGRVLVPVRAIAEALQARVVWDASTDTVTVIDPNNRVQLTVDSPVAYRNGQQLKLDAPPTLKDGRTLAPVRFIAEALGAQVEWDNTKQQVNISQPSDVWPGKSGLTENEWIMFRNQVTRFLIAFDERKREEGRQLVSSNFDTNLLGAEVVIPIGGIYPVIIDYKFIDAKVEAESKLRIRVMVYENENGGDGLFVQNWDFLVNRQSRLIEGLFVGEKQPLKSYMVFPGLTIPAVP